jgi:hypothetical protein
MIIYNVTSNVNEDIHEDWLEWIQHTHIPEVIATGKFTKARLVKVLAEGDHGHTYSIQYFTESHAMLQQYYEEDAPGLRQKTLERYGDQVLSFRTELQFISDHGTI